MNPVLIIIIAVCFVIGYIRGFVRSVVPVLSLVCSLAIFWLIKDWAGAFLFKWTFFEGGPILVRIVVVLIMLILVSLIFKAVFGVLEFLTKLPVIEFVDKVAGAVLGFAAGVLLAALLSVYTSF